ncbi:MAG: ribbon-helix-helix domain-containing protein [Parvibaculales bacterium]
MAQKPEKRSITIAGHATSISLEKPFWDAVRAIAEDRGVSLPELIAEIDAKSREASLSSAIRVYVLHWYQSRT